MNASGSRRTTSNLSAGSERWICAPAASEMSRSADAPPVRTPTRIFFTGCALSPGGERVTRAGRSFSDARARGTRARGCAARRHMTGRGCRARSEEDDARSAAGPAAAGRRQTASPLTHQFDFGHELDAEPLANGVLAQLHERAHVVRRGVTDVD